MSCREAVTRLWEFLDRDLDEGDHQALEQHLAFCRRCCGELEFARELRRLLQTKTTAAVPLDVEARLHGVIDGLGEPGSEVRL